MLHVFYCTYYFFNRSMSLLALLMWQNMKPRHIDHAVANLPLPDLPHSPTCCNISFHRSFSGLHRDQWRGRTPLLLAVVGVDAVALYDFSDQIYSWASISRLPSILFLNSSPPTLRRRLLISQTMNIVMLPRINCSEAAGRK